MQVINPADSFSAVAEHWSPKVLNQVNDQYIKVRSKVSWPGTGIIYNPVADDGCWIAAPIETVQTKRTGDVEKHLTKTIEKQIGERK